MPKHCKECRYVNSDEEDTCSLCSAVLPAFSNSQGKMFEEPRQLGKTGSGSRHKRVSDNRMHYLIPVVGEPIVLDGGKRFVIGRRREASLPLLNHEISRQHGEILWTAEFPHAPIIRDIDSRNGTFLNDKRVDSDKGQEIRDLDVIRFGHSFSFSYQFTKAADLDRWIDDDASMSNTRTMAAESVGSPVAAQPPVEKGSIGSGFAGQLQHLTGHDLFLMVEYLQLTGSLALSSSNAQGQVTVQTGQPISARFRSEYGVQAIEAMSKLNSGTFEFTPG
jgi:hypothetical protein